MKPHAIPVLSLIFLLFLTASVASETSVASVTIHREVVFQLPACNATIQMDRDCYVDSIELYPDKAVFHSISKPTYLSGMSYDLSTCYANSTLTIAPNENQTVTIAFPNWGDLFIQTVTWGYITDVSWEGQKLYITIDGPSGSGTLKVYCGSRGRPTSIDGLESPSYDATTKVLTGTYTLEGLVKDVVLDWTVSASPNTHTHTPTAALILTTYDLGVVHPGETVQKNLPIDWRGTTSIIVIKVDFLSHPEWFSVSLPKMLMKNAHELPITISIPQDAQPGQYAIPTTIYAQTMSGQTLISNTEIKITVEKVEKTSLTPTIPELMTWILLVALIVIPIGLMYSRR